MSTSEEKATPPRASSRLREKERRSYSEEDYSMFEHDEELYLKDEEAAIAADLSPYELNEREKKALPIFEKHPGAYLQVRNHILKKWQANLLSYLTTDEASKGILEKYKCFVPPTFQFLERFGYINTGYFQRKPNKEREKKQTVIVIGAGMAGLAAARQLITLGYEVVLLEARNRVGGRLNTDWSLDNTAIDLGASIITGLEGNPLTNVCKQLNIKLHKLNFMCPLFDVDGTPLNKEADKSIEEQFNRTLEETSAKKDSLPNSLGRGLEILRSSIPQTELEERVFNWHIANLEYACASDLGDVSLREWDQDDGFEWAGDHCLIPTGYCSIAKPLSQDIDIKYNTVVKHIIYNDTGVSIMTDNGNYAAAIVLVTLPLGVLKEGNVHFSPSLPEQKVSAIRNLGFGLLNKVVLLFPEVFWDDEVDYFGQINHPENRGQFYLFWNLHRCVGKPILVTLMAGRDAHKAENTSDKDLIQDVMKVLNTKFGNIPDPIQYIITRWKSDCFARGTYSYISLNSEGKDYDILAQPIGNRVFFAGEATMRQHPATAAGAYLSGLIQAGLIDEMWYGQIEINFDVEGLTKSWQEEVGFQTKNKKKYMQRQQKRSYQRGKKGLRVKETKLNETYSWLFTTSYRIPKKKLNSSTELSNSTEITSPTISPPKVGRNELTPTTRRMQKEQKHQRVVTKMDFNNTNLFSSLHYPPLNPGQQQNIPVAVPLSSLPTNNFNSSISTSSSSWVSSSSSWGSSSSSWGSSSSSWTQTTSSEIVQETNSFTPHKTPNEVVQVGPSQIKAYKQQVFDVVKKCLEELLKKEENGSKEQFKHLARKLTHLCIKKELKTNGNYVMNEEVKHKMEKFVKEFLELKESRIQSIDMGNI